MNEQRVIERLLVPNKFAAIDVNRARFIPGYVQSPYYGDRDSGGAYRIEIPLSNIETHLEVNNDAVAYVERDDPDDEKLGQWREEDLNRLGFNNPSLEEFARTLKSQGRGVSDISPAEWMWIDTHSSEEKTLFYHILDFVPPRPKEDNKETEKAEDKEGRSSNASSNGRREDDPELPSTEERRSESSSRKKRVIEFGSNEPR